MDFKIMLTEHSNSFSKLSYKYFSSDLLFFKKVDFPC